VEVQVRPLTVATALLLLLLLLFQILAHAQAYVTVRIAPAYLLTDRC